ncbi:MAG TPA: alpha/beta hydrolase [Acidimicrobiales bacterium]|nr:alpha/beta hydrolase [Acidimicrobiales bacterium]
MTLPTPILVLHDLGVPDAGRPWRDALADASWNGPVLAPDLPGHGSTPVRDGGSYEHSDSLLSIIPLYAELDPDLPSPIVVGVGLHGWAAQVLALAGRASGVVLVDGLGGP